MPGDGTLPTHHMHPGSEFMVWASLSIQSEAYRSKSLLYHKIDPRAELWLAPFTIDARNQRSILQPLLHYSMTSLLLWQKHHQARMTARHHVQGRDANVTLQLGLASSLEWHWLKRMQNQQCKSISMYSSI